MAKKLLIFLAVIAIAICVGWYYYNKPRTGVVGQKAAYQIRASDLYASYLANEKEADKKYLNTVLEVEGVVEDVQISDNDAVLILSQQPDGGAISCRFSPIGKLDTTVVKIELPVKVKGICVGFNMDVILTECELKP